MSRSSGFTLVELLVVVAILATVAGAAMLSTGGAEVAARGHIRRSELAEIRKAVLQFRADMGKSPRFLAELLQSPEPSSPNGGWWWRAAADVPEQAMRSYDPATRRGWNGPYLSAWFVTGAGAPEGRETRVARDGSLEEIASDETASPPQRLALLLSEGQEHGGPLAVVSDYRLEFDDPETVVVRFLAVAARPRLDPRALALGVRP